MHKMSLEKSEVVSGPSLLGEKVVVEKSLYRCEDCRTKQEVFNFSLDKPSQTILRDHSDTFKKPTASF